MSGSGNRLRGIACILVSSFGFALMAFFVRLCDDYGVGLSSFQKSFFRNAIALLIAGFVFVRQHEPSGTVVSTIGRLSGRQWFYLILRSLAGTVGIFANFYALSRIPLGEAMTLNKTAPFFTVLFAWLVMGERVSRRQAICLVVAFLGAVLVMKPTDLHGPSVWALIGGIGAGFAYACVHKLGRLGTEGSVIVFFFSAFSCLAALPFVFFDYTPMAVAQLLILLGAGCGAAIGQFGVTAAYRWAEPRSIAVFDYSNVIFTSFLGFVFFAQVPDLWAVCGFVSILLAAFSMRR